MTRFQFSWQQVVILLAVIGGVGFFVATGRGGMIESIVMGVVTVLALIARSPIANPSELPKADAAKFPDEQPTKKEGRSIPPLPVLFLLIAFATVTGCSGAKAPTARDSSRAAIELMATALPLANELCSKSKDAALLKKCADAYDVGRPSLIAAAQVVDVWAGASENDRACVLSASLKAVSSITDAMIAGGLPIPDIIRDALSFAGTLAGSCREVAP